MRRALFHTLELLLLAAALAYAVDWGLFRIHLSHNTATGIVQVHQFLATPLKGQKEEYDYQGDVPVTCSRTLYPQGGDQPCWWLRRHTTEWQ